MMTPSEGSEINGAPAGFKESLVSHYDILSEGNEVGVQVLLKCKDASVCGAGAAQMRVCFGETQP